MALPQIEDTKIIKINLPSGKTATIRPFVGKEEKLLLTAKISKEEELMMTAVMKVIENCVEEDISGLCTTDIEWILLQLRAISVSPTVEPRFVCKHCGHETQTKISITDIPMPVIEEKTKKIEVGKDDKGNTVFIVFNLPTFSSVVKHKSQEDSEMRVIFDCLEGIYVGEEEQSGFEYEEFSDWVLGVKGVYMEALLFIKNLPTLEFKRSYKCEKCGEENQIHLKGLNDFFTL